MDISILIGNGCSLIAMVLDSIGSTCRTARGMLLLQSVSTIIWAAGSIVLKGYSAAVQNLVALLRNLAAIFKWQHKWLEYTLILLGVVLGVCFNNRGWLGLLPVIGNLVYSIAVFQTKDERALKKAFIFSVITYAIFNAVILNIVGLIANIVILTTTVIVLMKKS